MNRIVRVQMLVLLLLATVGANLVHAEEKKPRVIRIGSGGSGYGKPIAFYGIGGTLHQKGYLEEEFKKEGVPIEWNIFKGAGPAVIESLANNLLDVGFIGDLPIVVGRSAGLKYKLIAGFPSVLNTYVVVPVDSPITSFSQLKGKKVGIFKGTATSLAFAKIARKFGLNAEKDIRLYNLDPPANTAALKTKDIDAGVFGVDAHTLVTQGVGRIIYDTRNEPPLYKVTAGLVVTEKFAKEHPDAVKRIVKSWLRAAKWTAENKNEAFKLWSKGGIAYAAFKKDGGNVPDKIYTRPLMDEFFVNKIRESVTDSHKAGLIRKTFKVEDLIDTSYTQAALDELNLENYWPKYDVNGKEKK